MIYYNIIHYCSHKLYFSGLWLWRIFERVGKGL